MRLSEIRHIVAEIIKKEKIENRSIYEFKIEQNPFRLIYLVEDCSFKEAESTLEKIHKILGENELLFKNSEELKKKIPTKNTNAQTNNWRGRILKMSDLLKSKNNDEFKKILFCSYWTITVSKYENEYFSMLNLYPSFFQPSQSVPGKSELKDSIEHPLSFLQNCLNENLIDQEWDRLKLGIEDKNRKIEYILDEKFSLSPEWREASLDTLIRRLSSIINKKL